MADSSIGSYRARHEDISCERLDGDVIAVNLATGAYFSLSGSAADVWTAAVSGAPSTTWLARLDEAYGTPVSREDVAHLLSACVEHGLVEPMEANMDDLPPLPADLDRSRWLSPVLEVFTDLQDLILVDPIHDAGDLGWPRMNTVDD